MTLSKEVEGKIVEETKRRLQVPGGRIVLHLCTLCDYECGWVMVNGKLYYDSGCNCKRGPLRLVAIDDVVDVLYMNPHLVESFLAGQPLPKGD